MNDRTGVPHFGLCFPSYSLQTHPQNLLEHPLEHHHLERLLARVLGHALEQASEPAIEQASEGAFEQVSGRALEHPHMQAIERATERVAIDQALEHPHAHDLGCRRGHVHLHLRGYHLDQHSEHLYGLLERLQLRLSGPQVSWHRKHFLETQLENPPLELEIRCEENLEYQPGANQEHQGFLLKRLCLGRQVVD